MAQVQKKTSTMSVTISSCTRESSTSTSTSTSTKVVQQKHSTLAQPICISPQRIQSPAQYTGNGGVAPSFVKCLHDVSTVKGQLVVLECRIRGTPPLQVMWYREDEQIVDSADFRILRKKASSASVPEELCTLVITEAFPEDSGIFKCFAANQFGTAFCDALLEVYTDLDEVLADEDVSASGGSVVPELQQEQQEQYQEQQEQYQEQQEQYQEQQEQYQGQQEQYQGQQEQYQEQQQEQHQEQQQEQHQEQQQEQHQEQQQEQYEEQQQEQQYEQQQEQHQEQQQEQQYEQQQEQQYEQQQDDFPSLLRDAADIPPPEWPDSPLEETAHAIAELHEVQPDIKTSERPPSESDHSPVNRRDPEPRRTPSPPHQEIKNSVPKPYTPASKLSHPVQPSGYSMNVADLPTFSPSLYPPSAFNYERPRHFIQSLPRFKLPANDNAVSNGNSKPSPTSSGLSSPISPPAPTDSPVQLPPPARAPMRSSVTLIPRVPGGPSNEKQSPAAFLCSVLPSQPSSQAKCISVPLPRSPSPRYSPTSPNTPAKAPEPTPHPTVPRVNHAPQSALPPQLSPKLPQSSAPPQQSSFVSLPINYKGTPNTLPKPILKKTVARPVSRSTDEEIQGSKDALIQDLEKKLRSKEARRRNSQKLSYEERMARRLLGPDNAASVFDLENSSDSQPDQPDSPEGRHSGGIWSSKHLSGGEGYEGSAIQEKCYAPRFLQVPADLTVEEGHFCRIDFKVGGLPTPDVSWYLDGKAIRPDDYHKMLVCEKGVHSFIIEIVTVHHAGVYECVATNRAGESRFSLRLDVIAQEMLHPPTFVVKMQNSRVLEGDPVRLECKVAASPPPQIYWKKDKEMLRIEPARMSLSQDGFGRQCLMIDRVTKSDAGWYTVSAINEAGMSTCNARLDVGTRVNKPAPAAKPLKMLPILSQFSSLGSDSTPRHTAPLYESEEL